MGLLKRITRSAPKIHPFEESDGERLELAILIVSGNRAECEFLTRFCKQVGATFHIRDRCDDAVAMLYFLTLPVVIYDRDLSPFDWRSDIRTLARTPSHPCVIVASSVLDRYLWDEVIQNGGYDVIPRPFHENELSEKVRFAWNFWKGGGTSPHPAVS